MVMKITGTQLAGFMVGSSFIYVFFLLLSIISGDGFSPEFFLFYWSIMILVMLLMAFVRSKKEDKEIGMTEDLKQSTG